MPNMTACSDVKLTTEEGSGDDREFSDKPSIIIIIE